MYIDGIVLASSYQQEVDSLKVFLDNHVKLKDLGNLKYFLGLEISRSSKGILVG